MEKERKAREEAVKQRQELEFRLRKFEGQARKANEALVTSSFYPPAPKVYPMP